MTPPKIEWGGFQNGWAFRMGGLSEWVGNASPPLFPALECSSLQLRKKPAGGAERAHVGSSAGRTPSAVVRVGGRHGWSQRYHDGSVGFGFPSPSLLPPGESSSYWGRGWGGGSLGTSCSRLCFLPSRQWSGGEHGACGMLGRCSEGIRRG